MFYHKQNILIFQTFNIIKINNLEFKGRTTITLNNIILFYWFIFIQTYILFITDFF